jgi:hypothetical protein
VRLDGEQWRGIATSAESGTFELSFTTGPVGIGTPGGGPGVAGTLTGVVVNTLELPLNLNGPVQDRRAAFGGSSDVPASLEGGIALGGSIASGVLHGDVVFSTSSGPSVACPAATMSWSVSPFD